MFLALFVLCLLFLVYLFHTIMPEGEGDFIFLLIAYVCGLALAFTGALLLYGVSNIFMGA